MHTRVFGLASQKFPHPGFNNLLLTASDKCKKISSGRHIILHHTKYYLKNSTKLSRVLTP